MKINSVIPPVPMKKLFLLTLFFYLGRVNAQSTQSIPTIEKIISNYVNNELEIEFKVNKRTANLLVLLSDGTGHTVFLDNRFDFAGDYKRTINLGPSGKGKYFLKVLDDTEQIDKALVLE